MLLVDLGQYYCDWQGRGISNRQLVGISIYSTEASHKIRRPATCYQLNKQSALTDSGELQLIAV